jgi:membrane protease YdiL (CAAX protease family)
MRTVSGVNEAPPSSLATRDIAVFLALTTALSAVFWGLIISAGSLHNAGGLYVIGLMWSPGVAALITQRLILRRSLGELGWRLGKVRYLLLAYAAPLGYCLVAYGATWLLGLGRLDRSALTLLATPSGVIQVLVLPLAGLLTGLGEEIGWRGFLVPRLRGRFNLAATAFISGAIWAAWHMPLVLFADYDTGRTPLLYAVACFTVMLIGTSFLYAWLRTESGGPWAAALLHGSHNAFVQQVFDPLTADTGATAYITGEFGAALAIVSAVIALLVWRRARRHRV